MYCKICIYTNISVFSEHREIDFLLLLKTNNNNKMSLKISYLAHIFSSRIFLQVFFKDFQVLFCTCSWKVSEFNETCLMVVVRLWSPVQVHVSCVRWILLGWITMELSGRFSYVFNETYSSSVNQKHMFHLWGIAFS